MKMSKKGFTLIELLIVIAIIGVLAVAFLPTLLGAPAKGRDTARIADMQKIQKVLVNRNLGGGAYPSTTKEIATATPYGSAPTATWGDIAADFGGTLPKDPSTGKNYYYLKKADTPVPSYSFGLWAEVEVSTNANATCSSSTPWPITLQPTIPVSPPAGSVFCYAVLTQ